MVISNELDELVTITHHKSTWTGFEDVERWLQSKGFESIGYGSRSEVFARPGSNRAVKVSFEEDNCWLRFALLAQKTSSPHLPKVHKVKVFNNTRGERLFIAVVERLTAVPISAVDWDAHNNKLFLAWVLFHGIVEYDFFNFQQMLAPLNINLRSADRTTNNVEFFDRAFGRIQRELEPLAKAFEKTDEPIANVLQMLKKGKGKCVIDLQRDNVLYRESTKDVVFVDPFMD